MHGLRPADAQKEHQQRLCVIIGTIIIIIIIIIIIKTYIAPISILLFSSALIGIKIFPKKLLKDYINMHEPTT